MRAIAALVLVAGLFAAGTAAAAPTAQTAYVERRGLMEIDARCRLLDAQVRAALEAGARQASGALLRSGWTLARLSELETAAVRAARNRPCDDARNAQAVTQARAGYASWARQPEMSFAGASRTWIARRYADAEGWKLRQDLSAQAKFGVRANEGVEQLSLTLQIDARAQAPSAVQLIMRDPARSDTRFIETHGRTATGLPANAAPANASRTFWARDRRVETSPGGARRATYVFPDAAFAALLGLDPREAVEIRTDAQRLYIEVGDVAAARTFLTLTPRR